MVVFVVLVTLGLYAACSTDGVNGERQSNQAPHVWLSAAPPEGSSGKYTVQLFWGGWDPDGEIAYYEYLVTDNETGVFDPADTVGGVWGQVFGNDSTFVFSADSLTTLPPPNPLDKPQVKYFERSHTFFIRAVDEEGRRSVEPAYRSFTSRTLSPEVYVTVPLRNEFNAADVPSITTFRWEATDYVDDLLITQEPDSVQWAMVSATPFANDYLRTLNYLRNPSQPHPTIAGRVSADEWVPFIYYRAPNDSGKFWTTPPRDYGNYIFAMRAKDEAGAVTPVLDEITNVRRVRVSTRATGPAFTVTNIYMGSVRNSSCNPALTILDIPAGVPLQFTLSASAESYGGTVSGYRYGWDIADLKDPEQWEVDYTPFSGTSNRVTTPPRNPFYFGTHIFTAEVIDNSGFCSRIQIKVNVVPFTLERNLLVVDDFIADRSSTSGWDNPIGRGATPNDAEHDQFWRYVVSGVDEFDPAIDLVESTSLPLTVVAQYKSIIWSTYGDYAASGNLPLLYTFILHRSKDPSKQQLSTGKVSPNLIALAMAAGGHILITGRQPIQMVVNRTLALASRYPLIFLYELDGFQGSSSNPEPDIDNPVGDLSFGYKELCLDTIDFADLSNKIRTGGGLYCRVNGYRPKGTNTPRNDTMREALPLDPKFPKLELRPEAAAPGKFYQPSAQGMNAEVYNPAYFRTGGACKYVPAQPRSCFQPIYGLGCIDTLEPTYNQPVAFWTSAFANVEAPGAVAARSAVFGFAPVYFNPDQVKPAIEYILFDEWKLPREEEGTASTGSR
jgi:hypothetical protein